MPIPALGNILFRFISLFLPTILTWFHLQGDFINKDCSSRADFKGSTNDMRVFSWLFHPCLFFPLCSFQSYGNKISARSPRCTFSPHSNTTTMSEFYFLSISTKTLHNTILIDYIWVVGLFLKPSQWEGLCHNFTELGYSCAPLHMGMVSIPLKKKKKKKP